MAPAAILHSASLLGFEISSACTQVADRRSAYDAYTSHLRRIVAKRAQIDDAPPLPAAAPYRNRKYDNPHQKPASGLRERLAQECVARPRTASADRSRTPWNDR
jgi:hypothetical protein